MELLNRRCLELAWVGHADAQQRLDQLQEVEGEAHHPPHQNALEEQIHMIIQLPVSQVEAAGIKDASELREDWHQQD